MNMLNSKNIFVVIILTNLVSNQDGKAITNRPNVLEMHS